MIPAEKVIVALDTQDPKELTKLFHFLQGEKIWVKIGMELFYSLGPDVISQAKDKGFKVFLDLKLHDIPNTVAQALRSLSKLPLDMVNIHAAGGREMMLRCREELDSLAKKPLLLAVTQLTSTSEKQLNTEQGIPGSIEESVLRYAKLSAECGLDGVVSSAHEVQAIKSLLGKKFLTVTPGIRPKNSQVNDQKRITTPLEAFELGSDYLVIGRPITGHPDPKEALRIILQGKLND